MNTMRGLLALLLVIVLTVISIAMPLFSLIGHAANAADKTAGDASDFSSAFAAGLQEPLGDYALRLTSMWSAQSNPSHWRLAGLLLVAYIALSQLMLLCIDSAYPTKQEAKSIFLVSWHILRAPPARA